MAGFDLSQTQTQTQTQIFSQKQIQSLEILSYGTEDLREAIYKASEENPALVISKDITGPRGTGPKDYTRLSSHITASQKEASDNFASVLEAQADERESLQEHLLKQFRVLKLPENTLSIGEKLIRNLDDHGFHILAPFSLIEKNSKKETEALEDAIKIIQSLDPIGTCTTNTKESLYIQALLNENASELTLFILNGHLDFLNPPQSEKVLKKIENYLREQSQLFAQSEIKHKPSREELTEENITSAINFIKTLDPFPARNFGTSGTHYITPDVYVEKREEPLDENDKESIWNIRLSKERLPSLQLDSSFEKFSEKSTEQNKLVNSSIKKAEDFLTALKFREDTLLRSTRLIVKHQRDFFLNGPGHLHPLKQADLARELGVHETTVSRMANSKFIQCEWGLFEFKYFFTNAVSRTKEESVKNTFAASSTDLSRDNVLHILKEILEEHKNDKKKLSDQKLSDMLAEQGIKVARRTVAKYRDMLNIESSYNR